MPCYLAFSLFLIYSIKKKKLSWHFFSLGFPSMIFPSLSPFFARYLMTFKNSWLYLRIPLSFTHISFFPNNTLYCMPFSLFRLPFFCLFYEHFQRSFLSFLFLFLFSYYTIPQSPISHPISFLFFLFPFLFPKTNLTSYLSP